MKNSEIIGKIKTMSNEFLARFVGILETQVTNFIRLFTMWLSRYSDGFRSIADAVAKFEPFWRVRCDLNLENV